MDGLYGHVITHKSAVWLRTHPLLYREILAEIFETSCATGSHARRVLSNLNPDLTEEAGLTLHSSGLFKRCGEVLEESDTKRSKLTTGEGMASIVNQMELSRKVKDEDLKSKIEDRKKRLEMRTKPVRVLFD
jgi:hypothetical protein